MSTVALSIVLVIAGQFLNALIVLIDKYIVTSTEVSRPSSYAFYVGITSGMVLFMLPFGSVQIPSLFVFLLSLCAGVVFIGSVFFLFSALKIADATDVVPWLGVVSTVAAFVFSYFLLLEKLPRNFSIALILFVLGMIFVGHFRFNLKSFAFVFLSGILFGLSSVIIKMVFIEGSFADGFFWTRIGNVIAALLLLISPEIREAIFHSSRISSPRTSFLIIFNRILGALAFVLILYAIRVGTVSLVSALSSLQFIFIFLLAVILMKRMPELFEHAFRKGHVAHKLFATLLIMCGFFTLFL